jgi:hypothetical protein
MRLDGKALIGLAMVCLVSSSLGARAAALTTPATSPFTEPPAVLTPDARHLVQWALETGDNQQQPFAVVDKKLARLFVFDAQGQLIGATEALLGQAPGDHSVPGVGDGDLSHIPLADRTTPAGRFASQPGRNLTGEAIVWFDYGAALAIHRLRPGVSQAQRLASLASATPADNRASLGCVVVAPEFYDAVVGPTLGQHRGVVYVLPESQPVQAMFGGQQQR